MIDQSLIEKARSVGGRDSWLMLSDNLEVGQIFYCVDFGRIRFSGFSESEKGSKVAIFEKSNGYCNYEYFYRELLCGDCLFLNERDCENEKLKLSINRLLSNCEDKVLFANAALKLLKDHVSIEVSGDNEVSKILDVVDSFVGDNDTVILVAG